MKGRGKVVRWSGRDWQGKLHTRRTQGRDVGEARARAQRTWEKILAESKAGTSSVWTLDDSMTTFIDEIVKPEIDGDSTIRPRTKDRYNEVLSIFRGSTEGRSMRSLQTAADLKKVLKTISEERGTETARQTRSVVSARVIGQMIDHGLLDRNPIHGLSMKFTKTERQAKNLPTVAEWRQLLRFLLDEDDPMAPMPGKTSPQSKKLSARQRHARVRELTLLQLATGLRINEALSADWELAEVDDQGILWLTVTEDVSKTKRARVIPVLVQEVAEYFKAQNKTAGLLIPQPTNENKAWDRGGAGKAVKDFYLGLVKTQGFKFLEENRSHEWRDVLTSAMAGVLPPHLIAAYFGHTPEVSASTYTDPSRVRPILDTAKLVL